LPRNELDALAIHQLRQEHVGVMTRDHVAANFSHRQQHNISSVSSTFDTHAYLSQSSEASFSPSEYKQLVITMKNIRKLGVEAQKSITAAFAVIKRDPEIGDFYRLLRKAIYNSVQIVATAEGNVAEKEIMNQILLDIWGITLEKARREANFDDSDRFKFRDFEQIKQMALSLNDEGDADRLLLKIEEVMKKQQEDQEKITTKFSKKSPTLI